MLRFEAIVRRWSAFSRSLPQFVPARPPHTRRLPGLERLEDRTVLSTFDMPVTSLADTGPGTLRAAITQADAGSATHTYNIEFKVFGTITLESALPDLSKSMNINGSGAHRLTVQRDPMASSTFSIFVVDADEAVRITGMTIAHGVGTDYNSGGGITNNGTLTVSHSTISGNIAINGGGGIDNNGTLTVSHSTISGNGGSGIYNVGTLTVGHSTISGNSDGPGIANDGTLTVSHSTISGNSAQFGGGGIFNNGGTATVADCTLSDNWGGITQFPSAGPFRFPGGGGIDNIGTLTVSHSTISGNSAGDAGGIENYGTLAVSHTSICRNSASSSSGGIENLGTLTVSHSTISHNSAGNNGGGIDSFETLTVSHSTISDNTATTGGGIDSLGTLTVSHSTISGNSAITGGGLYNSDGQAEIDRSTINDPNGDGVVNSSIGIANNVSTIHLMKTRVDGVLYNDQYFS